MLSCEMCIRDSHQAIIDYRTFATVRALREQRSTNHYRGKKINDLSLIHI